MITAPEWVQNILGVILLLTLYGFEVVAIEFVHVWIRRDRGKR